MKKQVRLTEDELRQMISESVHQMLVNEDNFISRWWKNRKNRNNQPQYDEDEEEYNGEESSPVIIGGEQPYYYNGGTDQQITPNTPNMDDWNEENFGDDDINLDMDYQPSGQEMQPEIQNEPEPQNNTPQQQEAEPEQNQAPQQQTPQQPAYKRGEKYHVAFSQENEDMFNNHITPTYNNLNNVIKSLGALREIGEHNYNQASSIFGYWGNNNYNGGQPAFKAVCQQIDSIMPTLQNLKKEMKNVLMANGVRDSEDYQHFNMEEQKMRKIISNSIQKVLHECKNRK